ncbi:MAG TPA: succinate dehydrogenase, hydrophobic membrane anchor protein [Oxalobacteraceae bacterium]|nr:succinate dehydrogenase, hydrophobic membrane anchor protein [Oxalobacteraceae bacterium]
MKKAISGFRAWFVQRFTALYMLLFILFALFHFSFNAPQSYDDWRGSVTHPFAFASIMLFIIALSLHAWVGLRDVLMDYVKPLRLRITLFVLLAASLAGLALWLLQILLLAQR